MAENDTNYSIIVISQDGWRETGLGAGGFSCNYNVSPPPFFFSKKGSNGASQEVQRLRLLFTVLGQGVHIPSLITKLRSFMLCGQKKKQCQIPWIEEPGRLPPLGSQRVGHDWPANTFTFSLWLLNLNGQHTASHFLILCTSAQIWNIYNKHATFKGTFIGGIFGVPIVNFCEGFITCECCHPITKLQAP